MLACISKVSVLAALCLGVAATPVLYNGRVPLKYTAADLDASQNPFLTVVKGTENASHYSTLQGSKFPPTPLWKSSSVEQVISVSIDNSSIFSPGGNNPQYGFRRTDIIAESDGSPSNLTPIIEANTTVFHFSIKADEARPLNYKHEYQIVFIEPNDGTHVFGIQLGTPFTPDGNTAVAKDAHFFKVLDHGLNVLFKTPFTPRAWHNFAVQVDWEARTLGVFYSLGDRALSPVTRLLENQSQQAGDAGKGEFHFGVLKLPLINPQDSSEQQGDVVHHGIQEGTTEGLHYSGIFVESIERGVSLGYGKTGKPIRK
ncbi:glycoside hydrolase family 131 protein [Macrolepiota fuliginosa MF-IS2]|uniref:Glycoside hydrolase family 131 protein n=1 Tax=Macrolepiota fuliginosa MF-IS2 TaxID=1400762 RepID=A0A9P5XHN0_9AGAR|nr:glycoside hydrolase family 131 protein [Macrolepiota fuliginosa MF-IS2]